MNYFLPLICQTMSEVYVNAHLFKSVFLNRFDREPEIICREM